MIFNILMIAIPSLGFDWYIDSTLGYARRTRLKHFLFGFRRRNQKRIFRRKRRTGLDSRYRNLQVYQSILARGTRFRDQLSSRQEFRSENTNLLQCVLIVLYYVERFETITVLYVLISSDRHKGRHSIAWVTVVQLEK